MERFYRALEGLTQPPRLVVRDQTVTAVLTRRPKRHPVSLSFDTPSAVPEWALGTCYRGLKTHWKDEANIYSPDAARMHET